MKLKQLKEFKKSNFILCNPNGKELYIIKHEHEKLEMHVNNIWQLTFDVDDLNINDSEYNDYYDLIVEDRMIFINNVGKFIITNISENDNGCTRTKTVVCKSIDYEITRKTISYMECKAYKFYDVLPTNCDNTFLGIVLSYLPDWSLGHVDISLYNKYRVFDIKTTTNIYNLLIEKSQSSYGCVYQFDIINKLINVYDRNSFIKKTDLMLSFENLMNNLKITTISEGIYTALTVSGANDMGINLINPLGTNTIYNLDSLLYDNSEVSLLSENLKTKWLQWKNKFDELSKNYADNILFIKNKNIELLNLENELKEVKSNIKGKKKSLSALIKLNEDTNNLVDEIEILQDEQNDLINQIVNLNSEINQLKEQQTNTNIELSFSNFFTPEEHKELDKFIKIGEYTDEHFAIVDTMSDNETIEMSQELYDKAVKELSILSKTRYSFEIDMTCPFFIENFQAYKDIFQLGSEITLFDSNNNIYKPILISLSIDFDNLDNVKFIFSESIRNQNAEFLINQILGQSVNVANDLAINNMKYNAYIDSGDKKAFEEMRTNALDLDKQSLMNCSTQTTVIDETGILCREQDENGINGFGSEQCWIIDNKIMFTDDYWKTAKLGVGKITLPNGQQAYGINGEVIIGNIVISENLKIYNSNNSFVVDENGAVLENATLSIIGNNGKNKILLNPNHCFAMQKKVGDTFENNIYFDSNGNANFSGVVSSSTLYGNTISGGNININNKFLVDGSGKLTATGAKISGNITLGEGSSINWNNVNSDPSINIFGAVAKEAKNTATNALTISQQIANGTYTGGTFIDGNNIYSPNIISDVFTIYSTGSDFNGFVLKGRFGEVYKDVFSLYYNNGDTPDTVISTFGDLRFDNPINCSENVTFQNNVSYHQNHYVDFNNCEVRGLKIRTKFA